MAFLTTLWLPILLSAVFVFVVSSVIHMMTPMHKKDWSKMPNEDKVLDALRSAGARPGQYMFPCPASMKDCGSPEMKEKYTRGPVGYLLVRQNGAPAIGGALLQWFLYSILISIFAAYLGSHALGAKPHYLDVFRITGTVAVALYALASIPNTIWKGESWGVTLKFIFDGILYGLVTAGTFGWLWPKI